MPDLSQNTGTHLYPTKKEKVKRKLVKEITLDMTNDMQLSSRIALHEDSLVTDRFHTVELAMKTL